MARLLTLVATFVLAGITAASFGSASAASVDTAANSDPSAKEIPFQIRPRHSDMCLTSNPGAEVIRQQTCDAPSIGSQRWTFLYEHEPEFVRIVAPASDRCVEVAGTINGSRVRLDKCDGSADQVFTLRSVAGSDYYRIHPSSSPNMCLTVRTDVPSEGAQVHLWTCLGDGQTNQIFRFVRPGASENTTVKAVPGVKALLFQIRSPHSPSKCLDYTEPGAVRLRTCAADPFTADQLWEVADGSQAGLNKFKSRSGKCLDVAGAGTANGTPVGLFTCGTQSNQQFAAVFVTGNVYQLRAGHSLGKCLDIKNDVPAEGAPLQLWDCLGAGQVNQHFGFASA